MFKELAPLLRKGDSLVLQFSYENDGPVGGTAGSVFRVNVIPKLFTLDGDHGEDRKALNNPVSITGTLAELDSPEFAATIQRFTASTIGLRKTIDDVEAAHKDAASRKLKPAATKPAAVATKSDKSEPSDRAEEKPEPKKALPAPKEITRDII